METELFAASTGRRERVTDITGECARFTARAAGGGDGLLHVFVPHATAGLALMELGARSDEDLLAVLAELLPAFLAPFLTIPVIGGAMALGTWQSIALVDLNVDNPDRQVRISFLG